MTPGTSERWTFGPFVLGCGTFGGIGGTAALVGRGLDEAAAFDTMDEAVELGITLFDTADRYADGASESMIGRWLAARGPEITGRVEVATKVAPPYMDGPPGRFDRAYVEGRFACSLERLGLDRVEILLAHAPDDGTPIEDTLEAFEAIRASGRCRLVGACNVTADQLLRALDTSDRLGLEPCRVVQNSYSLMRPDRMLEVQAVCRDRSVSFTAYSPLAGGALTGRYSRDQPAPADSRQALRPDIFGDGTGRPLSEAFHAAMDRLAEEAATNTTTRGALALAWVVDQPDVAAAVVGPSRSAPHLALVRQASGIELSPGDDRRIAEWFAGAGADP